MENNLGVAHSIEYEQLDFIRDVDETIWDMNTNLKFQKCLTLKLLFKYSLKLVKENLEVFT